MKDIDFDELDRAVSSVMNSGASKPDGKPDNKPVPTISVAPVSPKISVPERQSLSARPTQAASQPLARPAKPAGRFMDVVHPSSDMKTSSPAPVAVPRRLAPLAPSEALAPTPEMGVQPIAADTTPQEPVPPASAPETPFVPDPQVEKRPLGAFAVQATEEGTSEQTATEADTTPATPPAELSPGATTTPLVTEDGSKTEAPTAPASDAKPAAESLPPELTHEIVAVEANEQEAYAGSPAADDVVEKPAVPEAVVSPSPNALQGSIPQQYTAPILAPDKEEHALFDTSAYHQPLPAKTSPHRPWVWIVLIIVLLAAGAAAGAFWYMTSL